MESTANKKSLLAVALVLALLCEPTIANLIRIPLTKATTEKAGLLGQAITSYYAPVAIGSPQRKFIIQFEIALGSTFVPHDEYSMFRPYLNYRKGFKCKASTTCSKVDSLVSIEYQRCSLDGKLYEDFFTFGTALVENDASNASSSSAVRYGITVRQNFLAISDASTPVFKKLPIDGFIGLAPHPVDNSKVHNIMHSLRSARLIDKLQFSFQFNRSSIGDAQLTLGGYGSSQINWHSLATTNANIWMLDLRSVSLGHQNIACHSDCKVKFSSVLNEVYGPQSDVEQIYRYLGVANLESAKRLTLIDCAHARRNILPILKFTIGTIAYKLWPKDYIKMISGSQPNGTCYIAILPNSGEEKLWTLGTNFLELYDSVFDLSSELIGFAK